MTSLYNRATPRQKMVMRMIEGACLHLVTVERGTYQR